MDYAGGIGLALIAALAWGCYMSPLKISGPRGHHPLSFSVGVSIGIALYGLVLTLAVDPSEIPVSTSKYLAVLWAPMLSGFLLMTGLAFGFNAISNIGMSRAIGIWNMCGIGGAVVAILFFGEMRTAPGWAIMLLLVGGAIIILGGVICGLSGMIQERAARASTEGSASPVIVKAKVGFVQAALAAVFFSFFLVPVIAAPDFSGGYPNAWLAWSGVGAIIGAMASGYVSMGGRFNSALRVPVSSWAGAILGGVVFGIGWMAMNTSIAKVGLAIAYPIVLSDAIVSALLGIYVFKELRGAPKVAYAYVWLGTVVVLVGVALVAYARSVPQVM